MKFYHFGDKTAPVILLLPGTCCHWKRNFGEVIPLIETDFHVVCVSYDGFDETEQTVFPDMLTETEKIEQYIQEQLGGQICAAYGCSLGGSFVGLLLQRKRIHINYAILGSSDLDQDSVGKAKLKCKIAVPLLHKIVSTGEYPKLLQGLMEKKRTPYRDKFMAMFGIGNGGMPFMQKESVYNQFYSDLITPLEGGICVSGTTIHCFYAAKMGDKYLERYQKHFKNPVIHHLDMEHEELLLMHPEQWAEEIITLSCAEHKAALKFYAPCGI
ncbi:MAG: alpha/beta hydrolase [Lachnospiraceae bacterium]|nr:alpha/beta hydrolase [Lachnospiraceae bacterium]